MPRFSLSKIIAATLYGPELSLETVPPLLVMVVLYCHPVHQSSFKLHPIGPAGSGLELGAHLMIQELESALQVTVVAH